MNHIHTLPVGAGHLTRAGLPCSNHYLVNGANNNTSQSLQSEMGGFLAPAAALVLTLERTAQQDSPGPRR